MKLFDVEIPIDGLAVTLATFILSPSDLRLRNTVVIAAIHGYLHPYEVGMHIEELQDRGSRRLRGESTNRAFPVIANFNDKRFSYVPSTIHHDIAYFKHNTRSMFD